MSDKKPIIIIVHGMGNHTKPDTKTSERGSFGKEFIEACNKGFDHFEHLKGTKIEDEASIVEIHYNDIFDEIRERLAENGKSISEHIAGTALTSIPGIIESITSFESKLNEDDFEYTHWLDVALYKTFFGNMVRLKAAEEVCKVIGNYRSRKIHIVGHSLGTGVVHDAMHQLYNDAYSDRDNIADLATLTHKIDSVWMVANVSRVLNTVLEVANPYNSLVRPSTEEDGMCRNFFNVHHELDPFTWPKRFKRVKTDNWIRQSDFNERYLDIETQMVTRYNTHDIKQYFEDPRVLGTFAHFVLEKGITVEELEAAEESYRAGSIEGAGAKIRNTFMNIELDDQGSIKDFFKAMDKGIDFLKDMEENG